MLSASITTIASFNGANGETPGSIVVSGNTLYGVTASGGAERDGEVFSAPTVTGNPANRKIVAGKNAQFYAVAPGYPTPTVQWYVKKAGTDKFEPIEGATSSSYKAAQADLSESGNLYEAVFTNSTGSATTTAAKLDVVSTPPTIISATTSASTHNRTITASVTAPSLPGPVTIELESDDLTTTITAIVE